MPIITIGIDLAKNIFAVHGVNESGHAGVGQTQGIPRSAPAAHRQFTALAAGRLFRCRGRWRSAKMGAIRDHAAFF